MADETKKKNEPQTPEEWREYFRKKLAPFKNDGNVVERDGEPVMYLPLQLRKQWLKKVYPQSRIIVKPASPIGDAIKIRVITCTVYENGDINLRPLATGIGEAYQGKNPEEDTLAAYLKAEAASIKDALKNAGFLFGEEASIEPPMDITKLREEVEAVKAQRRAAESVAADANAAKKAGSANIDMAAMCTKGCTTGLPA